MRAGEGAESADLMRHEQGELAAYDGSGVYFGFWLLISTARPTTDITTARPLLLFPWSPRHLHQLAITRAQDTAEGSKATEELEFLVFWY